MLTKGDVLAYLEGVKNGTIKTTAPAVAKGKKAEVPRKAGSGKVGEYTRVLDVSKLEEMRDALNGGSAQSHSGGVHCLTGVVGCDHTERFGTSISTPTLLLLASMRAIRGTSLDTGNAAILAGSGVSTIVGGGHMGADDLSRNLGALPASGKANGGLAWVSDLACFILVI